MSVEVFLMSTGTVLGWLQLGANSIIFVALLLAVSGQCSAQERSVSSADSAGLKDALISRASWSLLLYGIHCLVADCAKAEQGTVIVV